MTIPSGSTLLTFAFLYSFPSTVLTSARDTDARQTVKMRIFESLGIMWRLLSVNVNQAARRVERLAPTVTALDRSDSSCPFRRFSGARAPVVDDPLQRFVCFVLSLGD